MGNRNAERYPMITIERDMTVDDALQKWLSCHTNIQKFGIVA
jgi:hypothetical protein